MAASGSDGNRTSAAAGAPYSERVLDRFFGRELAERLLRSPRVDPDVAAAIIATGHHRFVDWRARYRAYDDVSEPLLVAQLLTHAELRRRHRVLELGTGSGFCAAVASRLAGEVVTIEPLASLATEARHRLANRANVRVLDDGAEADGAFDVILVRCGDEAAPRALVERLSASGTLLAAIGGGVVRVARMGAALVTVRDRSSPA